MNKHLLRLFTFFLFISIQISISAQGDWKEGFARADGFTEVKGVVIQFQQTTCQGKPVLFLKMINNNNYSVEITWEDAVLNSDDNWVKNKVSLVKSVILNANENLTGTCEGKLQDLKINLADFSVANNFKYFKAVQLNINQVSK